MLERISEHIKYELNDLLFLANCDIYDSTDCHVDSIIEMRRRYFNEEWEEYCNQYN